jgi:membrane fusion protein (multidrug efflux system)
MSDGEHDNRDMEGFVNGQPPEGEETAAPAGGRRRPWRLVVLAILVIVAAIGGYRYLQIAAHHISTDDAYLTADITQISPQVSGTISRILVDDNQKVKAGQLLVVLDDSTYRDEVAQAQANLEAAVAAAQGAGISVDLTAQSGAAAITQAQGVFGQAQATIRGAQADLGRARAGVDQAGASAQAALANIGTAQAGVTAAQANQEHAAAAVEAAQAQLDNAQSAVQAAQAQGKAAQAQVTSAEATAAKAKKDLGRYSTLLEQNAVSAQMVDQAQAASEVADAGVQAADATVRAADDQVKMAQSAAAARQADVQAARRQVQAAQAMVAQQQATVASAQASAGAAQAGVRSAQQQVASTEQTIQGAQGRRVQAHGQMQQAGTAPHQVALSGTARAQALAKISQAQAALQDAQTRLAYCRLYAPVEGTVSQKTVQVGALVQPGTPLMALVQPSGLYVEANYKETQLQKVYAGQPVVFSVDALGGQSFRGHVDSIAAATGATFALLPPDNATGNFTKVVQRVPVKIVLEPGQSGADRLRAGMSVEADVVVGEPPRGAGAASGATGGPETLPTRTPK